MVIDKTHLKELFDAPEQQVSFISNASRSLQIKYTLNKEMEYDHYHAVVTKMQLSRHIPELMPAIVDELVASFTDSFNDIGSGSTPLF